MEFECTSRQHRVRKSQESYTSDGDSGVGPDSTGSSRMPSMEGHPAYAQEEHVVGVAEEKESPIYYSWMIEECILAAYSKKCVNCPTHNDILLAEIAPDTVSIFNFLIVRMIMRH